MTSRCDGDSGRGRHSAGGGDGGDVLPAPVEAVLQPAAKSDGAPQSEECSGRPCVDAVGQVATPSRHQADSRRRSRHPSRRGGEGGRGDPIDSVPAAEAGERHGSSRSRGHRSHSSHSHNTIGCRHGRRRSRSSDFRVTAAAGPRWSSPSPRSKKSSRRSSRSRGPSTGGRLESPHHNHQQQQQQQPQEIVVAQIKQLALSRRPSNGLRESHNQPVPNQSPPVVNVTETTIVAANHRHPDQWPPGLLPCARSSAEPVWSTVETPAGVFAPLCGHGGGSSMGKPPSTAQCGPRQVLAESEEGFPSVAHTPRSTPCGTDEVPQRTFVTTSTTPVPIAGGSDAQPSGREMLGAAALGPAEGTDGGTDEESEWSGHLFNADSYLIPMGLRPLTAHHADGHCAGNDYVEVAADAASRAARGDIPSISNSIEASGGTLRSQLTEGLPPRLVSGAVVASGSAPAAAPTPAPGATAPAMFPLATCDDAFAMPGGGSAACESSAVPPPPPLQPPPVPLPQHQPQLRAWPLDQSPAGPGWRCHTEGLSSSWGDCPQRAVGAEPNDTARKAVERRRRTTTEATKKGVNEFLLAQFAPTGELNASTSGAKRSSSRIRLSKRFSRHQGFSPLAQDELAVGRDDQVADDHLKQDRHGNTPEAPERAAATAEDCLRSPTRVTGNVDKSPVCPQCSSAVLGNGEEGDAASCSLSETTKTNSISNACILFQSASLSSSSPPQRSSSHLGGDKSLSSFDGRQSKFARTAVAWGTAFNESNCGGWGGIGGGGFGDEARQLNGSPSPHSRLRKHPSRPTQQWRGFAPLDPAGPLRGRASHSFMDSDDKNGPPGLESSVSEISSAASCISANIAEYLSCIRQPAGSVMPSPHALAGSACGGNGSAAPSLDLAVTSLTPRALGTCAQTKRTPLKSLFHIFELPYDRYARPRNAMTVLLAGAYRNPPTNTVAVQRPGCGLNRPGASLWSGVSVSKPGDRPDGVGGDSFFTACGALGGLSTGSPLLRAMSAAAFTIRSSEVSVREPDDGWSSIASGMNVIANGCGGADGAVADQEVAIHSSHRSLERFGGSFKRQISHNLVGDTPENHTRSPVAPAKELHGNADTASGVWIEPSQLPPQCRRPPSGSFGPMAKTSNDSADRSSPRRGSLTRPSPGWASGNPVTSLMSSEHGGHADVTGAMVGQCELNVAALARCEPLMIGAGSPLSLESPIARGGSGKWRTRNSSEDGLVPSVRSATVAAEPRKISLSLDSGIATGAQCLPPRPESRGDGAVALKDGGTELRDSNGRATSHLGHMEHPAARVSRGHLVENTSNCSFSQGDGPAPGGGPIRGFAFTPPLFTTYLASSMHAKPAPLADASVRAAMTPPPVSALKRQGSTRSSKSHVPPLSMPATVDGSGTTVAYASVEDAAPLAAGQGRLDPHTLSVMRSFSQRPMVPAPGEYPVVCESGAMDSASGGSGWALRGDSHRRTVAMTTPITAALPRADDLHTGSSSSTSTMESPRSGDRLQRRGEAVGFVPVTRSDGCAGGGGGTPGRGHYFHPPNPNPHHVIGADLSLNSYHSFLSFPCGELITDESAAVAPQSLPVVLRHRATTGALSPSTGKAQLPIPRRVAGSEPQGANGRDGQPDTEQLASLSHATRALTFSDDRSISPPTLAAAPPTSVFASHFPRQVGSYEPPPRREFVKLPSFVMRPEQLATAVRSDQLLPLRRSWHSQGMGSTSNSRLTSCSNGSCDGPPQNLAHTVTPRLIAVANAPHGGHSTTVPAVVSIGPSPLDALHVVDGGESKGGKIIRMIAEAPWLDDDHVDAAHGDGRPGGSASEGAHAGTEPHDGVDEESGHEPLRREHSDLPPYTLVYYVPTSPSQPVSGRSALVTPQAPMLLQDAGPGVPATERSAEGGLGVDHGGGAMHPPTMTNDVESSEQALPTDYEVGLVVLPGSTNAFLQRKVDLLSRPVFLDVPEVAHGGGSGSLDASVPPSSTTSSP